MACLLSMTLSVPLSASHWFTKETAPRKSVFVGLSSQPISETVFSSISFLNCQLCLLLYLDMIRFHKILKIARLGGLGRV
ncbi:unnamed protein product [Prunus armeniaca]|uniref:Uncharacterized protein n=1 Tax=Prunus armeniaca TaxID=36596 RepID=A0A6J5V8I0_PRUAR|nr:unnamed protein product [Prunus armeniaca]